MADIERHIMDPLDFTVYRLRSDYEHEALYFEPWELLTILRWLQEHFYDLVDDMRNNAVIRQKQGLTHPAELIDRMALSADQRVELDEGGMLRIVQEAVPGIKTLQNIRLDAEAATMLFDFLLSYQERYVRWRYDFSFTQELGE